MEFMMGGIFMFGGNFAPRGYASCEGQLVAIADNQAMYAILGTTWGGDGRTNFALPDLRSRVPAGVGYGPGISIPTIQGRPFGTEFNQMTINEMPDHTHTATFTGSGGSSASLSATAIMSVSSDVGNTDSPKGAYLSSIKSGLGNLDAYQTTKSTDTLATDAINISLSGSTGGITGGSVAVGSTGGGRRQNNIQPSLGMQYLICTQGYFPSRS